MREALAQHRVELWVFLGLFVLVIVLGFWAARWRQPTTMYSLNEWGLGGRSFGPVLTWFLATGDLYTAATFIGLPALLYGVGAGGFFAVPFLIITLPLVFVGVSRMWSVAHVHGLVTPADFVRVRSGPRPCRRWSPLAGILGTLPYIALQLVGMEAVFAVMGLDGKWPLWTAFGILALFTYNAGLRRRLGDPQGRAASMGGPGRAGACRGEGRLGAGCSTRPPTGSRQPSRGDGLLLSAAGQVNSITLVLGSGAGAVPSTPR